jgi:hypothetical protein
MEPLPQGAEPWRTRLTRSKRASKAHTAAAGKRGPEKVKDAAMRGVDKCKDAAVRTAEKVKDTTERAAEKVKDA